MAICRLGAALVVVLAAAAASPAVAAPRVVSPRGLAVQQLELAASGARSAVVMEGVRGRQGGELWVKLSDRPLQQLDGFAFAPQVAVGADGTAIAAWVADQSLRAAIARPGRGFGRPRTLATAPSDIPNGSTGMVPGGVAVGRNGVGVIAWRHGDGPSAVVRVVFRKGRGFAAPLTLGDSYEAPALARTPDDAFVVGWKTHPVMPLPGVPPTIDSNPRVLIALAAPGARTFGAPVQLAGPPAFIAAAPSAFTGPGGAAVAWQEQIERRVAVLAGAGAPVIVDLGPAHASTTEYDDPVSLAMPADGSTVAVWRLLHTTSADSPKILSSEVVAAPRPAGGRFSAPQPLSPGGRLVGPPVAVAVGGRTIAAWAERVATGHTRLRVRLHDGHGWRVAATVATADTADPVRLVAAGRSALLAWNGRAGRGGARVYVVAVPAGDRSN